MSLYNKRPFLRTFLLVLSLNFTCLQTGHTDIIAIFACDTYAQNIEKAVQNDLRNMRDEAQRIAMYTQQDLKELIFDGDSLRPRQFLNTLKSLSFTEDDIVLFYFSGHGYRTHSKSDNIPWPNLFFTRSGYGIDYDQVLDILSAKNQRFLFSIADCCNNFMGQDTAPPVFKKKTMSKAEYSLVKENYKKLFLETRGQILVTSSDVSEFSWCMTRGAIFTLAFLDYIQDETMNATSPSWDSILMNTRSKVLKHQTSYYYIATY